MARNIEFDRDQALDRATDCFHCHGYHASSMQMLVEAMGIGRGSLYAAFGDKRALFDASLNRYGRALGAAMAAHLEKSRRPLATIRSMMRELVDRVVQDPDRKGCLVTNTAVELGGSDPDVTKSVDYVYAAIEDVFYRALCRAQEQGELKAGKKPRALARFLVATIQGVRVIGRVNPDPAVLKDIVESALLSLD